MPAIATSVNLPVDVWFKCRDYGINRSKIAREAICKEIECIEKERGIAAKANTPNAKPIRTINREMEMQNEIGTKP